MSIGKSVIYWSLAAAKILELAGLPRSRPDDITAPWSCGLAGFLVCAVGQFIFEPVGVK